MNRTFDVEALRAQFPALFHTINGKPLVYLDSAATAQKPQCVIQQIQQFYSGANANVHRGASSLTNATTTQFENARSVVADYIGAKPSEIVWTRGATESINLVAQTYGQAFITTGDEILVSEAEHHANIVPWQMLAQRTGASVIKIPVDPLTCELDMEAYLALLSARTKLVAISHISNVTGIRHPIEQMIAAAKHVGAKVLVDGAQGLVHERIDVKSLDADFYVFSGHKLFGPSGIGVLFGKQTILEIMPPWHGGGKMVKKVSFSGTEYAPAPARFEAGTPNMAGAVGLAAAIRWLSQQDLTQLEHHVHSLYAELKKALQSYPGLKIIGAQEAASILSFTFDDIHHSDIAELLDQQGITVRSGHHCAHPLMEALRVSGTVRVSLAAYNTSDDIHRFIRALDKALELL